ncbi:uncharacterized protein [Littorina saxatilis]|uniref:WH1 domain-containing protein n=1 Tax=Littorina saxatilis TaxID=31220 RepID=A0AAN9BMS1_9CAEN
MSITKHRPPNLAQQHHKPSFSGSLPGLPDSAFQRSLEDDESLPLPDHFPEPVAADIDLVTRRNATVTRSESTTSRTSVTLEPGQTLVYSSPKKVVKKNDGGDVCNGVNGDSGSGSGSSRGGDANEFVRKITDKYAAPGSLRRNGSISSYSRSVTVKETLPSSPPPSITISPAVVTQCFPFPPINGGLSTSDIASTATTPTTNGVGPYTSMNGGHSTGAIDSSEGSHSNSGTLVRNSVTRHSCSSRNSGVNNFSGVSLIGPSRKTNTEGRLSSSSDALSPRYSSSLHSNSASELFNDNVLMRNGSSRRGVSPLLVSAFSNGSSELSDAFSSPAPTVEGSVRSVRSVRSSGGSVVSGPITGGSGTLRRTYESVSGISVSSLGDGVSAQDIHQVEMFYRSHKAEVIVCHSLANFYIGAAAANDTTPSSAASTPKPIPKNPKDKKGKGEKGGGKDQGKDKPKAAVEKEPPLPVGDQSSIPASGCESWEFVTTGIPLLVLDTGEHHRTRSLSIVVAEKGTGFELWRDVVSHLTSYACPHANFHTLRLSSDTKKLGGFSFDDSKAAGEFANSMQKILADPDDELLMLSKKGKKKKKRMESIRKKLRYKPPKKSDISQPCCFEHVTKLEQPKITGIAMPLPPNSFPPAPSGSVSSLCDLMHDSLSLPLSRARSASSGLSDGTSTMASSDH